MTEEKEWTLAKNEQMGESANQRVGEPVLSEAEGSVNGPDGTPPLPDGWVWTTLGEITEPSKEKVNPQEIQRTPYIGLEHIEKDAGKLLGFGYSDEVRSTKAVFHRGDLLYGKLRPYLNKVHIADFDGVCSTDILVFPKSPHISNRCLLYRLLSGDFVRYANLNISGVQHPRTNFKVLSRFPLALPPAAEQHRIVAEIETHFTRLDAGVAALERAQANLRRYKASVLKATCEGRLVPTEASLARAEGRTYEPADQLLARILAERRARWEAERSGKRYKEPATPDAENLPQLPEGWIYTLIELFLSTTRPGMKTGPFGSLLKKHEHQPEGVPVLGIENIGPTGYVPGNKIFITEEKADQLSKYDVQPNDILISRSGTVGQVCIAPEGLEKVRFSTNLMRIVLEPNGMSSKFFRFLFKGCPFVLDQVSELCSGSTRDFLNQKILKSIVFPLPPLAEQRRIVAEVERRLSVVAALEGTVSAALARARRLRQAVLKRAFEGRLVEQNLADEPASVLLGRIKAEKAQCEVGKKIKKRGRRKKQRPQRSALL